MTGPTDNRDGTTGQLFFGVLFIFTAICVLAAPCRGDVADEEKYGLRLESVAWPGNCLAASGEGVSLAPCDAAPERKVAARTAM